MKIIDFGVRVFRHVSRQVRDSDGHSRPDPMDADGFVHPSPRPGLGDDINFDYINGNLA